MVGIACAHVTKGKYLHEQGGGFIEIEPTAARDQLRNRWNCFQFAGFGPHATEVTPFGSKMVQRWAAIRWDDAEQEAEVKE